MPGDSVPQVFTVSAGLLIVTVFGVFVAGLLTENYSHVDRLWSVLPPVYAVIWGIRFFTEPLFMVPAVLVILWGARLTLNFARRGGYRFEKGRGFTGEDYRWPILRKKIGNRVLFEIFNLIFISAFQLLLIFLFTLPLFFIGIAAESGAPFTVTHFILGLLFFLALLGETAADNQQFRFQENKVPGEGPGFNTEGLWRYSRHPNYGFELSQWIILAAYAVVSGVPPLRAGVGAVLLVLLFAGSTKMTEDITRSKYPEYGNWQKITSPWFPGVKTLVIRRFRTDREPVRYEFTRN
jgi:steroid 5-alpha reductase family enzyme